MNTENFENVANRISSIIDAAENEGRVLTAEEEKEISLLRAKLDLLKKYAPKSAVAPIVVAETKFHDKVDDKKPLFKANNEKDYVSGLFYLSLIRKDKRASDILNSDYGFKMALSEGTGSAGGYLVPREMYSRIIELIEQYGVFRANALNFPIGTLNTDVPLSGALPTASFVNENAAFTATDPAFGQVTLTAKKLGCLIVMSKELDQDQVVQLGDYLNRQMATAIAYKEDDTGFNGDGTSGHGGITGVKNALATGSKVVAGTGRTSFGALTIEDFLNVVGKLPRYALANAKWYISPAGRAASMMKLQAAAGGNNFITLQDGSVRPAFLGYPVVETLVLNSNLGAQTSTDLLWFGSLNQTAVLGTRMGFEVNVSEDRYFELYQIGILGVERIDIKVFNPGTTSVPGGMIALRTPAS